MSNYLHLALRLRTPLLENKLRQCLPHAVLVLDGGAVLNTPGVGLLPQNTKAWRDKSAYVPVTDPDEQAALFKQWISGRRQGLEVLVPYGLSLDCLVEIVFFSPAHLELFSRYSRAACPNRLWVLSLDKGSDYPNAVGLPDLAEYFETCIAHRRALPPPNLPFD